MSAASDDRTAAEPQVNANDTEIENVPTGPGLPTLNVDYYNSRRVGLFRGDEDSDREGPRLQLGRHRRHRRRGDQRSDGEAFLSECRSDRAARAPVGPDGETGHVPWFTIVGVAKDVKQGGLDQNVGTEVYFNIEQGPRINQFSPSAYNFVLRSTRPVKSLAPAIQNAVRSMDPGLPIVQLRGMEDVFGDSVARQRFLSLLLAIFAGVALVLAAIGTYGVLSYLVTERQREIGIRVALGASTAGIVRLVLQQGMSITLGGVAAGVVGALGLARVTRTLLFGVSPTDPATYIGVAAMIVVIALIACLVPARRAMRVDPLVAIRNDSGTQGARVASLRMLRTESAVFTE